MTDLRTAFSTVDRLEPPDVWPEVKRRGPRPSTDPQPSLGRRVAVVLVALAVAGAGFLFVTRAFRGSSTTTRRTLEPATPVENGMLAFSGGGIYTMRPGGGDITNLTRGYDQETVVAAYDPQWSPDGTRVAFRGYPRGGPTPSGGANYDIYTMNADGSGLQNITTSPADIAGEIFQGSPSWSPDGSMIAYEGDNGLYVMNADGSGQTKVADGGSSSWSPDGSRLVTVIGDGNGNALYTVAPDGSGLTQLTRSSASQQLPAWSPDGNRIAFVRSGDHASSVWVVNADGTGEVEVASIPNAYPYRPIWSPDGTALLFEAQVSSSPGTNGHPEYNHDIYSVGADGTGLVDLTPTSDRAENAPVWAPDGTKIAFEATGTLTGENAGTFDIYVMNPDGTGEQRLTTNQHAGGFDLAWQPLPVDGSEPTQTETPIPASAEVGDPFVAATVKVSDSPDWNAGGIAVGEGAVWVSVQGSGQNAYVARIDPGTNEVVARIPVNSSPWDIAAGAGSVWVTGYGKNKTGSLQRIDPATNQVVATITVEPSGHPGVVAAGSDAVWVDVGDTDSDSLVRVDPSTNQVVATVPLPGPGMAYVHDLRVVGDTVWVQETVLTQGGNSDHGGDVIRIDGATNQVVATIPVNAQNMAAGPDAVWVSDRQTRQGAGWILSEIDPRTNEVVQGPFSLPDQSGGFGPLFVDQNGVWLHGYDEQERVQVIHVDAGSHEIDASSRPIDSYYTAAAYDSTAHSFWVTAPSGSVSRLELP
jgi:Tol biopolymer transport system component